MKASPFQLRIFEADLEEAIQGAQVAAAAKLYNQVFPFTELYTKLTADDLQRKVSEVDPTESKDYASWLISIFTTGIKTYRQAEWVGLNPEKAVHQNIIPATADPDEEVRAIRNRAKASLWPLWRHSLDQLRNDLKKYDRAKKVGQLLVYGVSPSIDKYKTIQEFWEAMRALPDAIQSKRDLKRGIIREFDIEGSELINETSQGVQVYKVDKEKAAEVHAGGTSWCIRRAEWAQRYLGEGPLFFVYIPGTKEFEFLKEESVPVTIDPEGPRRYMLFTFASPDARYYSGSAPSGATFFEIRDTSNEWVIKADVDKIGLFDVVKNLSEKSYGTGLGFSEWAAEWTVINDSHISPQMQRFMHTTRAKESDVRNGTLYVGDILKRGTPLGQLNAEYLESYFKDSFSKWEVKTNSTSESLFKSLTKAFEGKPLDQTAYNRKISEARIYYVRGAMLTIKEKLKSVANMMGEIDSTGELTLLGLPVLNIWNPAIDRLTFFNLDDVGMLQESNWTWNPDDPLRTQRLDIKKAAQYVDYESLANMLGLNRLPAYKGDNKLPFTGSIVSPEQYDFLCAMMRLTIDSATFHDTRKEESSLDFDDAADQFWNVLKTNSKTANLGITRDTVGTFMRSFVSKINYRDRTYKVVISRGFTYVQAPEEPKEAPPETVAPTESRRVIRHVLTGRTIR